MGPLPAINPKRECPRLARERMRYTSSIYHSVVSFLSRTVSSRYLCMSQPLLQPQDVMSRLNLFTGRQVRKESAHCNGFFKRRGLDGGFMLWVSIMFFFSHTRRWSRELVRLRQFSWSFCGFGRVQKIWTRKTKQVCRHEGVKIYCIALHQRRPKNNIGKIDPYHFNGIQC